MNAQTSLTSARFQLFKNWPAPSPERASVLSLLEKEIGYPAPAGLYGKQTALDLAAIGVPANATPIAPLPKPKKGRTGFKIALCIGHARSGDRGASSTSGIYEEDFYSGPFVESLKAKLEAQGFEVVVIDAYQGSGYGSAMRWVAARLLALGVDFAVELHFNAASPSAEGFEYLFWHKSKVSRVAAQAMQDVHAEEWEWMKNRQVEPLGDEAHERGVLFVSLTHCPALILEPFFGSSQREVAAYMADEGGELVGTWTRGISSAADALILQAA